MADLFTRKHALDTADPILHRGGRGIGLEMTGFGAGKEGIYRIRFKARVKRKETILVPFPGSRFLEVKA